MAKSVGEILSFFDERALELQARKVKGHPVLERFAEPQYPPGYDEISLPPRVRGIHFIGDVPYDNLTIERMGEGSAPPEPWIKLKRQSVRQAITAYFPPEEFRHFLSDFLDIMATPGDRYIFFDEFEAALETAAKQINPAKRYDPPPAMQELDSLSHHEARWRIHAFPLRDSVKEAPEVAMTVTLFHAAHTTYLWLLKDALLRNDTLTEEEEEVATSVIDNSFEQFTSALYYKTILSAVYMIQEHTDSGPEQAMEAAMQLFQDKHLFSTNFSSGVTQTCPAKGQLLRSAGTSLDSDSHGHHQPGAGLVSIFHHVQEHREAYAELFERMEEELFPHKDVPQDKSHTGKLADEDTLPFRPDRAR